MEDTKKTINLKNNLKTILKSNDKDAVIGKKTDKDTYIDNKKKELLTNKTEISKNLGIKLKPKEEKDKEKAKETKEDRINRVVIPVSSVSSQKPPEKNSIKIKTKQKNSVGGNVNGVGVGVGSLLCSDSGRGGVVGGGVSVIEKNKKLRFIDLFCGIGGFHQALKGFGYECVFASDIDEKCRDVYYKNYGVMPEGDITKIDEKVLPDFDILCGGFPCQSFSNAGKKKSFRDTRGTLFEHILRIAEYKKPMFMFLENVKHIRKIDGGKVFKIILERINEIGYFVSEKETVFELSPHQLGIPQHRERVIFVCIRKDIYQSNMKIDIAGEVGKRGGSGSGNGSGSKEDMIDKIIEKDKKAVEKYKISADVEAILTAWDSMVKKFEVGQNMSPTIMCNEFYTNYSDEEFLALPAWKQDYITKNKPIYKKYKKDWDKWYRDNKAIITKKEIYGKLEWQSGKKKANDSIWNYFIQLRQSGIRVKKTDYFPTLVAIVQTPIYAKEKRYITPRECARLQSFPDDFVCHTNDQIAYKQFGNSVNVDVVKCVMEKTLRVYGLI